MSEYKASLTRDEYLKALALFIMANEHYVEAVRFEEAINKITMPVPEKFPGGHVGDAVYQDTKASVADFNEALKLDGIAIDDAEGPE